MADRPYTVVSCCMSLDGYLDDATEQRLELSNASDFDRVDAMRAGSDAILVGAATIRADDPALLVKSAERRAERVAGGAASSPVKVTLTRSGRLDADARFFATSADDTLVYAPAAVTVDLRRRLGDRATVVDLGPEVELRRLTQDLSARGVNRLMVEGGGTVISQFLTGELADQLDLVVAPFFVGDARAQRFVEAGRFPWTAQRRATLAEATPIGDVVLLRYALSARFGEA